MQEKDFQNFYDVTTYNSLADKIDSVFLGKSLVRAERLGFCVEQCNVWW